MFYIGLGKWGTRPTPSAEKRGNSIKKCEESANFFFALTREGSVKSFALIREESAAAAQRKILGLSGISDKTDAAAQRNFLKLSGIRDKTDAAAQRNFLKLSGQVTKLMQQRSEKFHSPYSRLDS